MKIKTWIYALVLFFTGFISRYILTVDNFSSLDSVQYAIGTFQFSLSAHTPPPPGYFLYIMTGKLFNLFLLNPHDSMVLISVLYSALIGVVVFLLGKRLFSTAAGFIASVLFLTSPVFWYKGVTIYGYLNVGFFLILTVLFCYMVLEGKKKFAYLAMVSYSLAVGARPQELPMLLPFMVFIFSFLSWRQRIKSLLLFSLTTLAWLIPLILVSGGMSTYMESLRQGSQYLADNSIFGGAFLASINNHIIKMGLYFHRTYLLGVIPLFYYAGRFFSLPKLCDDRKTQFIFLLVVPVLLFNIFIQFAEIGHGMVWGLVLFVLVAEAIVVVSKDFAELMGKFFKALRQKQRIIKIGRASCRERV